MKLLTQIFRYQLLASLVVLLLGTGLFYISVRYLMDQEVNRELASSQVKVSWQLRNIERLPVYILQLGDSLQLDPVVFPGRALLREKSMFSYAENAVQPYRQLIFYERVEDQWYRVTISKLLLQRQQLRDAVVMTITFIVALLLISLLILNGWLSERIWRPFYRTLGSLDRYRLEQRPVLEFEDEKTLEFNQLNLSVKQLTERVAATYKNLKEFTGNAAHEIQTPLAVIISKIEELFQDETLTESQLVALSEISEAANRLSRLNQALLLLTKIENRQFPPGSEFVNFLPIVNRKLKDLEDLIDQIQLRITSRMEPAGPMIHPGLAEILVNNLLTNAIRHNIENGEISVLLQAGKLQVSNTGRPVNGNPELLFERFRKESTQSASLGLGLALAKTICDVNGISLTYEVENNRHNLTMTW
jgi:two-component system, OmpR family, sensor histidine kinase QseC